MPPPGVLERAGVFLLIATSCVHGLPLDLINITAPPHPAWNPAITTTPPQFYANYVGDTFIDIPIRTSSSRADTGTEEETADDLQYISGQNRWAIHAFIDSSAQALEPFVRILRGFFDGLTGTTSISPDAKPSVRGRVDPRLIHVV
jgi:hypothetical protein